MAACGGSGGSSSSPTVEATAAPAAPPASADVANPSAAETTPPLAVETISPATAAPVPETAALTVAPETVPPETAAPTPSSSGGTCSVTLTGGVNDAYTGTQSIGDAYLKAWFTPEEIAQADAMFPGGAPEFQIACAGEGGRSMLVTLFDTPVAYGASSVTVPVNEAGYFSADTLFGNAEPFDISFTKLDETGVAGSYTFVGSRSLSAGEPATITVTFDFVNLY